MPPHVVLCEKRYPLPPDHGRATRVITLAHALRGLGFRVTLIVCQGRSTTLEDGTRIRALPWVPWPFREFLIWAELRKVDRGDHVDFFQVQNDIFVLSALLATASGYRVLYDAQVVERAFWAAVEPKSPWERVSSWVMPLCERVLCRIAARVSTLSDVDARELEAAYGLSPGAVISIPPAPKALVEAPPPSNDLGPRPTVLFLGSYDHRPNADAIGLIAREIRPRVLRAVPEAVFQIVGKGLPSPALEAQGLEAHANVETVTPFIDAAAVCIAPVRIGSGVRTKLIEYLSRGKPVVAMTAALEGLAVRPGVDLIVADDPSSFADAVAHLLQDGELRRRIAASGLRRVDELAGKHVTDRALSAFYGSVPGP